MFFKDFIKVNIMEFANIFDIKVVNYQAKYNRTPLMAPETRGGGTLIVVVLFGAFFKEDVC